METMRRPYVGDARQLLIMLEEALHKEQAQWQLYTYNNTSSKIEVMASQRNDTVHWLEQLNKHFQFYPETFFLSVTMLDKVLHAVKVQPRYLKCIGISCFFVAAKTLEEDEMVPSTLGFVQQSGCGCSVAEVLRMERRILDILSWDLRPITPLDFLHIFHASLLTSIPHLLDGAAMTPARQLSLLTRKLQAVCSQDAALQFPPSVLALALLSLELQQFLSQWFTVTHIMQRHVQVSDEDLIRATEIASQILGPSVHTSYTGLNKSKACRTKYGTPTKKRKVAESEDEDDNIYEGIKRLYNDDPSEIVAMGTCRGEVRQDQSPTTAMTAMQTVAM